MKALIAGNWKMNLTLNEAKELTQRLVNEIREPKDDIAIFPPFIYIPAVYEICKDSPIKVGAQNCYYKDKGAFTGEVSISMLSDMNLKYVICGHSERRTYFNETDELIYLKVKAAIEKGIVPIVCVGETLEERENLKHIEKVSAQIEYIFSRISFNDNLEDSEKIVIAYEPIWAIGTGKNATPKDAYEMHKMIRKTIEKFVGSNFANSIRILYGGSVNTENIDDLMNVSQVDGVLVGGASLNFDSFKRIIEYKTSQC
ncbi:MAG TPA: triose-phosphate isomerase [Exilispira sp.]|nr:triose-phosphate isomerase [Exilispira sp.]